jgi:hypothetical protein
LFGAAGLVASHSFGPVAGWRAVDVAVGADGQNRILWTHQDGRMALWRIDGDGKPTARGPIYPPPPGFTASRIAAGVDGLTRVLGTIKGDRFTSGSTASATLSGATLEITLDNSFGFIPGGRMHLHR